MRTTAEIIARIKKLKNTDFFGFETADLISQLAYKDAKEHLRPDTDEKEWDALVAGMKPPLEQLKEYLDFAWEKANDCRGISASRSLTHIVSWLWLAGVPEELLQEHFEDYDCYGKKQLVIASELVGFDWREADDGRWVNDEASESISATAILAQVREALEIAETIKEEIFE